MSNPDRLHIALRLKAARMLNGGAGQKGAAPLSTATLAEHPLLAANGITKNRIEDIEQMSVDARPMELEKLAEALHVPYGWFRDRAPEWDLLSRVEQLERRQEELIAATVERLLTEAESAGRSVRETGASDRPLRRKANGG